MEAEKPRYVPAPEYPTILAANLHSQVVDPDLMRQADKLDFEGGREEWAASRYEKMVMAELYYWVRRETNKYSCFDWETVLEGDDLHAYLMATDGALDFTQSCGFSFHEHPEYELVSQNLEEAVDFANEVILAARCGAMKQITAKTLLLMALGRSEEEAQAAVHQDIKTTMAISKCSLDHIYWSSTTDIQNYAESLVRREKLERNLGRLDAFREWKQGIRDAIAADHAANDQTEVESQGRCR